ncbi:hypothetical protein ACVIRO_005556 [Rhizobium ruizarguesonis]|nr:hypothetical protein G7039_35595 [Rhizobium leguminosarum]
MCSKTDPPTPPGATDDDWRAALQAERLRIDATLMEIGLKDRTRLEVTMKEYIQLRNRVGEQLFYQANKALSEWEERQKALKDADHMRLPFEDWRAWARVTRPALAHRRLQCSVGQGGFHVGIVRECTDSILPTFSEAGTASVFYVYDCGSEPRKHVDQVIAALIRARDGRSLDFLFLSHFDRDHMCGIPRLLAKMQGLQVDTVVLPYVDHVERLLAFGRSAQTRGGAEANRFFAEMVVDPVATLQEFGPRQIIFVDSGEEPAPDLSPSEPPRGPVDRLPSWKAAGHGRSPPSWSVAGQSVFLVRDPTFDLFNGNDFGGWQLVPFVDRVSPKVVENFKRVAEALLNWEPRSFAKKVADRSVRCELVTRHRSTMARAYKHSFENKNITSLCLYSGPAKPKEAGAVQICPRSSPADIAKVAWMGTGDANLKDQHSIDRFEAHYGNLIPYISTFLLPHHGSIHNSDPQRLISTADRWVAAAEPRHDHFKHPAKVLVDAVKDRSGDFRQVKSDPQSALDEAVVVYWPRC